MLWLREIDALGSCERHYIVEAELGSEILIPGLVTYPEPGSAQRLRIITFEPDSTGLYKYILRFRCPQRPVPEGEAVPPEFLQEGTSKGYVFPDGPIGELAALLSLRLQARFFLLSTSLRNGGEHDDVVQKTEHAPLRGRYGRHVDRVIFTVTDKNTTQLAPFLDKIRSIPAKHHLEIAVAADHYARALRMVGVDEEMVFVRLVSAVEKVMGKHPGDPLADKLLEVDGLTREEIGELKTTLQARRSGARFVAFLEKYSAGFFDAEPREPAHIQVKPETLGAVAKAIYRARSGYLHAGDPMYLSAIFPGSPQWHSDPSVGRTWQNRSFTQEQKLPCADFFHRLVRHCLLARIDELAAENAVAAATLEPRRQADA